MNITTNHIPITNIFLWQEISSCDRKFLPVTGNFVQWQERSSCNRKFLNVTRNFFLSVSVRGNFFHWQNISSYDRKFLYVTGNFFMSQEISSWNRKSLLVATFHPSDIKSRQKCVIFGHISKSRQKCVIFAQNFAWDFKASWQDSCHLARENPTLAMTLIESVISTASIC